MANACRLCVDARRQARLFADSHRFFVKENTVAAIAIMRALASVQRLPWLRRTFAMVLLRVCYAMRIVVRSHAFFIGFVQTSRNQH